MASDKALSRFRWLTAVLVGFVGSIIIWVIAPFNNYILGGSAMADDYLPMAAMALVLVLVLLVNPLLRRFKQKWALEYRQLALVLGIMLVASVLPGQGLLGLLPYSLARTTLEVRDNSDVAAAFEKMDLPASLFPDTLGYQSETPVADYLVSELLPGMPVPWAAWLGPLITWGILLVFCWFMMIGLAMVIFPQWRHNERLAFPLLTVQQAVLEDPAPGETIAPLFKNKAFWIAAGMVFVLHLLNGGKQYFPENIPAIPLRWNLGPLFTEEPWRYLHSYFYSSTLFFSFVGIAFFMPNRSAFSVWFIMVAYFFYLAFAQAYWPPVNYGIMTDHRNGAMVSLTFVILYLGRERWKQVGLLLYKKPQTPQDRNDRRSLIMFLLGCLGIFSWLVWAGVSPWWALIFVGFGFMVALLIARIVAETGMPFIRVDTDGYLAVIIKASPLPLIGPIVIFFAHVMTMLFSIASRVNTTAVTTHALGLDPEAPPDQQRKLLYLLPVVLVVGLIICGSAHLQTSYHHSTTLDGMIQPVSPFGHTVLGRAFNDLGQWNSGSGFGAAPYSRIGQFTFGAGLAALLQWACIAIPRWPLHPIGLLMVYSHYARVAWFSIFLGWLIKIVVVRYGGAMLFRKARGFFLGLIIGEVIAAVFWAVIGLSLALMGKTYIVIEVLPLS